MGKNNKKSKQKSVATQSKYKCELCDNRDKDKPIVACDVCDKWYHFSCVNIVSINERDPWICDKCKPKTNRTEKPKYSCVLCQHADNTEMIRCEDCLQEYHLVCVKLDLVNPPSTFHCGFCVTTRNITEPSNRSFTSAGRQSYHTNELTNRTRNPSLYDRRSPVPYSHQSYASRRNTQLELDYLEEQRKNNERWDREKENREQQYLQRKYQLLKENIDTNITPSVTQRSEYTENWIRDHQQSQQRFDNQHNPSVQTERSPFDMSKFQERLDRLLGVDTSRYKQEKEPINTSPRVVTPKTFKSDIKLDEKRIPQDEDLQVKPTSEQGQTLSKAQIASRHVVKSKLQNFYGNPLEWTSWHSSYENSTTMCGYTNGENLERLKECLKGKAETAVKHRLLHPSEVPKIIATLRMLYGRPELIVDTLLQKISEIQAPKADRLETLVDYAMEVKNVSAAIEAAKLHYHLSNPTLIKELVAKLPTHAKIDWAKYQATQTDITLKMLADWLYNLAEILCTVTVLSISKAENKFDKKTGKGFERVNVHQTQQDNSKPFKSRKDMNVNNTDDGVRSPGQCKICNKRCQDITECQIFKSFTISQKWEAIKKNKLCRKCLRCHSGYCRLTTECGIDGCVFKHHPILHSDRTPSKNDSPKPATEATTAVVTNNFHHASIPNILFRIVPVTLYNNEVIVRTYAYLDEGSSGTLIEEELADELQIVGLPERLCLLWTNNVHRIEKESRRMDLAISGQNEFSTRYVMRGVRSVKDLGLPKQTVNKEELVRRFSYLREIPLINYVNETPRILVGLPDARLCTQLTSIEGDEHQPIASKSRIGWSVHGPTKEQHQNNIHNLNEHRVIICERQHQNDEELHRLVKKHFTLENFGVKINNDFNLDSKENERALKILRDRTRRVNGRFETALLWRYDHVELEDSYQMAKRRLICLEKSKSKFIQTINDTIDDYITKGYVNKLTPQDLSIERSKVGYLPIFIVVYPKKPDKLRMVFDAAAKTKGKSLNDMLLKGPDQLSSLIDILRRFREKPIAICADITEMYHQIKVCDEDKHVQRFLWRNGNTEREPDEYVLNVMTFGAKCSPSSAQFIKNSNAEEFRKDHPKAVDAIVSNTYVDDMMDGDETPEQVIQLVNDVHKIHEHGGFKIGKFLSNSSQVLEALGVQKIDHHKNIAVDPIQNLERVLGMFWNTTTDCFMFSLKYTKIHADVISGKRYPTKREILQTLMSIYDPLGLLQHFLVRLKVLLQYIWRSNLKWDEQLVTENQKTSWDSWFRMLHEVETLEIPRLYSSNLSSASSIDLHVFVDASEDAYSAVAFLRIQKGEQINCVNIGSKTRVAPIKYISTPRLELQAGVLGTRFMISIEKSQNFEISRRYIWSDSRTVMSWIRSDHKKYQQFVAHRIGEILENSEQDMWRWLPGKENVADDATKWVTKPSFDTNSRWFNGPDFLYKSDEYWPTEEQPIEPDIPEEMKVHCLYTRLIPPRIIDPQRFSNWNRMVRALSYVIRYVKILRAKIYKEKSPGHILSQDDIIKARNLIIRQAQYEGYPDEMATLKRNQSLPDTKQRVIPPSSSIISCTPYLDENCLLRVRGRIDKAKNISFDTKHPMILPKMNRITSLLVHSYHQIYIHRNNETVINEIRQRFFIPQLRVILKMVKKNCQYCRHLFAKPQPPEMGDLPYARLAVGFRVYTYTGVDYFGPMYIVDGRTTKKRWGVLFTCLTTRAIHIEIAYTLNTESCIFCLRNFIARYGPPREIYSDNGTNLVGADNELSKAVAEIDVEKLASTFTTCYTEWKFNPPAGQHQGGVWERLIRSVKTSFYDILPDRTPNDEQFRNLLAEIQFVVNSRPLTFVPLEHEYDEALTPNHFIMGSSDGSKPIIPAEESPNLRSKWRENQRLTDLFWKRFVKEYLPTLTRRTKWFRQVEPLKVGDLVLIMDADGTRNSYPRAKIIETVIGSNGQVRRARVQRHDKTILWRPATKLAKLDVEPPQDGLAVKQGNNETVGSVTGGGSVNEARLSSNDVVDYNN